MDFVHIPAGELLMGSDKKQDPQAYDNELPQHKVYLDEYWIGVTPVSVAQFTAFVQSSGYVTTAEKEKRSYTWRTPHDKGSDVKAKASHPVTCVDWQDAAAFCEWLTSQAQPAAKWVVRLPSEAEWEKAARGADGRLYPWGRRTPDAKRCNFKYNVCDTTPVGKYSPGGDSPYGCADMAGNVWQWLADWYSETYYQQSPTSNPAGPSSGEFRVQRGGAWINDGRNVRSAHRCWSPPRSWSYVGGFRCAASPQRL